MEAAHGPVEMEHLAQEGIELHPGQPGGSECERLMR